MISRRREAPRIRPLYRRGISGAYGRLQARQLKGEHNNEKQNLFIG
jgi:hypothetical protein